MARKMTSYELAARRRKITKAALKKRPIMTNKLVREALNRVDRPPIKKDIIIKSRKVLDKKRKAPTKKINRPMKESNVPTARETYLRIKKLETEFLEKPIKKSDAKKIMNARETYLRLISLQPKLKKVKYNVATKGYVIFPAKKYVKVSKITKK